ncbi:CRISPR-associated endonuclease Cas1 [Hydrogenibacillus sp. N12]|uniref:CRISPR-associated endonuclease Cas1 n=1 Tax=Hydrogenibacillus sp. N12 TaxID=2866627 RepID=UPI001C7D99F9|nr:CRISPR-associated endonuclease Cas1 [Hydrogenibacillus sp. N12]QZA32488.1 CRISPR-associated endonuclease Cas1 [Hydrogenibacillus sp. N12]
MGPVKETLYITGSGRLSRKDRTLRFDREGDDRPRYVPIERIQDIFIFGEVELNKRFLAVFVVGSACFAV